MQAIELTPLIAVHVMVPTHARSTTAKAITVHVARRLVHAVAAVVVALGLAPIVCKRREIRVGIVLVRKVLLGYRHPGRRGLVLVLLLGARGH
jgi:hypothetical protein